MQQAGIFRRVAKSDRFFFIFEGKMRIELNDSGT